MGDLIQNKLIGKTIHFLSQALDFRSKNHSVISSNLANIDTPGYQPRRLVFEDALQDAINGKSIPIRTTDPKHFSHQGQHVGERPYALHIMSKSNSASNQLDIDKEMSKMVQNNLLYEAYARLLSKKFQGLRTAIDAGRR